MEHVHGVVYVGRDDRGEKWKAVCVCGWWAPVRTYLAGDEQARKHVAAQRRGALTALVLVTHAPDCECDTCNEAAHNIPCRGCDCCASGDCAAFFCTGCPCTLASLVLVSR